VWGAGQTLGGDLRLSARAGELASHHLLRGDGRAAPCDALEIAAPELPVAFATFDRTLARAARRAIDDAALP